MNIEFKIKEGKTTTTHSVDFTPTEDAINKIAKNISSIMKSFMPTVTKTTETKEDLTHKD